MSRIIRPGESRKDLVKRVARLEQMVSIQGQIMQAMDDMLARVMAKAGLNPKETEEMVALLQRIHAAKDLTLFVTEHVMEVVMPISQRIIVLDGGQKIAEGKPQDIANDERVIRAYLGEKYVKGQKH